MIMCEMRIIAVNMRIIRVLIKELNTFHSGTFICKLQDGQYDCIQVHDPVITVLQITMLSRIVQCSTHPAGLQGLRLPTK